MLYLVNIKVQDTADGGQSKNYNYLLQELKKQDPKRVNFYQWLLDCDGNNKLALF